MDLDARLSAIEARLTALERKTPVAPGEFEQFWAAYPKKVGKQAALKAFKNAQNRPRIDDLLQAIDQARRSEQWRKDGGQFIPNPATWLNQGRWDDEPAQVAAVAPAAYKPLPKSPAMGFSPPPDGWLEAITKRIGKGMP